MMMPRETVKRNCNFAMYQEMRNWLKSHKPTHQSNSLQRPKNLMEGDGSIISAQMYRYSILLRT